MKKSTTIFDFFKKKVLNDLKANTSGVTLPTTNVYLEFQFFFFWFILLPSNSKS